MAYGRDAVETATVRCRHRVKCVYPHFVRRLALVSLQACRVCTSLLMDGEVRIQRLEEETEIKSWTQNGGLFTCTNKERFEEYKRFSDLGHFYGIESHVLTPAETKELYPLLNVDDVYGSIYSPGDGTIDPNVVMASTDFFSLSNTSRRRTPRGHADLKAPNDKGSSRPSSMLPSGLPAPSTPTHPPTLPSACSEMFVEEIRRSASMLKPPRATERRCTRVWVWQPSRPSPTGRSTAV